MTSAQIQQVILIGVSFDLALRRASSALTVLDGLPDMALPVLVSLNVHGSTRPRELARTFEISSASIARLLDRLEDVGLIERAYNRIVGDRRAIVVELTELGRDSVEQLAHTLVAELPSRADFVGRLNSTVGEPMTHHPPSPDGVQRR